MLYLYVVVTSSILHPQNILPSLSAMLLGIHSLKPNQGESEGGMEGRRRQRKRKRADGESVDLLRKARLLSKISLRLISVLSRRCCCSLWKGDSQCVTRRLQRGT